MPSTTSSPVFGSSLATSPSVNFAVSCNFTVNDERVWELLTDTSQWPLWGPTVRAVECPVRYICQGTSGRVRTPIGLWLPFRTTERADTNELHAEMISIFPKMEHAGAGQHSMLKGSRSTRSPTRGGSQLGIHQEISYIYQGITDSGCSSAIIPYRVIL